MAGSRLQGAGSPNDAVGQLAPFNLQIGTHVSGQEDRAITLLLGGGPSRNSEAKSILPDFLGLLVLRDVLGMVLEVE